MIKFILLYSIILLCLSVNFIYGQCTVTGSAASTNLQCGYCTSLSAFGQGQGQTIFSENFNTGTFGPGWQASPQAMWNNPCSAAGVDNTTHIWMGNSSPVPRILTTQSYDLTAGIAGVTVCFDMLFATQGNSAPCEGPDEPQEGVYLQYSTDGGANWVTIHYFDPNGGSDPQFVNWNNWCFPLPAAAITASTQIRWYQDADSGADYDHWGIDNVQIYFNDPTFQIVWQHDGYNLGAVGGTDPTPVCPHATTTYTVIMSNGTGTTCSSSVTVNVVMPTFAVTATPDTTVCTGSCVVLHGTPKVVVSPAKTPTYENNQITSVTSGSADVNINVTGLNMTSVLPGSVTSVCINSFSYNSAFAMCTNMGGCTNCDGTTAGFMSNYTVCAGSFEVILKSPNGCQVTLVPVFEASGNYPSDVCFVPSGGQNISLPSFPSAGNWNPSQPLSNLNGCTANGVWTISFNAPGGASFGVGFFTGWNITFNDPEISYNGAYTWSPTTNMTGSNTLTPNVCPVGTTTYNLNVTDTAGCGTGTGSATVTVSNCTFNVVVNSASVCPTGCTNITATVNGGTGPYSYVWSTGGFTTAGPHNVCPAGTTIYSVTVTDNTGATATASGTVTLNGLPNVSAGNDATVCGNVNTTLTATGATSYSWDNGLGAGASHVVSPGATTTYTVTGTDVNGCVNTDQVIVNINTPPSPVIAGSLTFCTGNSTTLNAGTYSFYLWSPGGATTQTLNVNTAGTYYVTVTNSSGCTGTASVVVTQSTSLSPVITGNTAICSGGATILDAGNGFATYNWLPGGSVTQTLSVSTAGNYYVTVTDGSGCSGTATAVVTVNALPVPTAGSNSPLCSGATLNLTSGGGVSYSWSGPNGFTSTQQNPTIAGVTNAEVGSYTVVVTNASGCSASASVNVVVNALPVPTANSNTPVCGGTSLNLTSGGGATYSWSGPNGFTSASQNPVVANVTAAASGTYTVSVTASGCTTTATTIVTVNTPPAPIAGSNTPVCAGATLNLTSGGGTTYSWSGPNSFTSTLQNPSITVATTATTGTYTVIATTSGCSATATTNVVINNTVVATANSNSPVCAGATVNLTSGGGVSYSWSGPNGFNSILQNPSITNAVIAATGNYIVTVTNTGGCIGTDTVVVVVNALPIPTAGSNSPVCVDAALNLTSSGGTSYSWSGPNSFISGMQNPVSLGITIAASGTYTVTVTNTAGCTKTATTSVTVNALHTVTIGSNSPLCAGANLNLTSSGGISYSWDGPNSFTSVNQNPILNTVSIAGSGTYTVTVTNAAGCTKSETTNVTVNSLPTPLAGSNSPLCVGDNLNLSAGGGGSISYSWSGPNGFTSATQFPQINGATTAAAGIYTVTVTNAASCTATTTATVVVNSLPVVTTGSNSPVCELATLNLTSAGGITYTWSGPDGFYSTLQNPSITGVHIPATGTYTVTVIDAAGCSASMTTNATVNVNPNAVITGVLSFCTGNSTTLDAGAGFSTYSWNAGSVQQTLNVASGGLYSVTVSNSFGCIDSAAVNVIENSNPVPVITGTLSFCQGNTSPLNAGSGYVVYSWNTGASAQVINVTTSGIYLVTVTDGNGCVGNTSATVTVNLKPLPLITPGGPTTFCQGDSVVLDAGVYSSYLWSTGSTIQNISAFVSGTYFVTVTNAFGCSASASLKVTVNSTVIVDLDLTVMPNDTICPGVHTVFTAHPSNQGSLPKYYWMLNGMIVDSAKTAYSNDSLLSGDVVSCILTSSLTCADLPAFDQISISLYPTVPIDVSSDVGSGCEQLTVHFNEYTSCVGCTYLWSFGDGGFGFAKNPVYIYKNDGVYDVSLSIKSEHGCVSDTVYTHMMTVFPRPEARYYISPINADILNPGIEFHNISTGGSIYTWSFGDGAISTEFETYYSYKTPGIFLSSLLVETDHGCKDTAMVNVRIDEGYTFYAPTAFTPDKDGNNDIFFVAGRGIDTKNFYLAVYDRWGSLLYETQFFDPVNPKQFGWNGKVNGDLIKSGTFTWYCSFSDLAGKKHEKSGPVTIIR